MSRDDLIRGLCWYIVFVVSTVLHEAAHAFASWRLGDPTAYRGGQVSLDPLPHIQREPVGMVLVPIVSFLFGGWMIGWASAPYDPSWAWKQPRRSALMALAGPAANLLLVLLAGVGIRIGLHAGLFYAPEVLTLHRVTASFGGGLWAGVASLLGIFFFLNLVLFVFNLLPLPPLDGSGVVPLFLSTRAARQYLRVLWQPTYSLMGLILAWVLFGHVFQPVLGLALRLLYPGVEYS